MEWYLLVLKKYVVFEGRSRRKEYWMFTLFSTLATYLLQGFDYYFGLKHGYINFLSTIYGLAVMLPTWGVGIRRLHDVNKSGWNMLWVLLPIIGWFYLFVLGVRNGDVGENQYGPDPKNPTTELDDIGVTEA